MRLIRVARKIPPCLGGQEYHVVDLSKRQSVTGHRVTLFYGMGDPDSEDNKIVYRQCILKNLLKYIPTDSLQGMLFGLCAFIGQLFYRGEKFDLVHVHGDVFEIVFALLIGKKNKAPVVVTIHAGLNQKPWYRFIASRILRWPSKIICVSEDIKQQVCSITGGTVGAEVIHSGIVRSRFLGTIRNKVNSKINVVSVGRLHKMKGFEYLIEAMSDTRLQDRMVLKIIGDGEEYQSLVALAEDLKTEVQFLGRLTKPQVAQYLEGSDIFVSSSVQLGEQTEGTPTVVMEAMASGLPIITTDVGGAKAIVENGINGVVVTHSNAAALANALLKMGENESMMNYYSVNNIEKSKEFDWDAVSKRIEAVYDSIEQPGA